MIFKVKMWSFCNSNHLIEYVTTVPYAFLYNSLQKI